MSEPASATSPRSPVVGVALVAVFAAAIGALYLNKQSPSRESLTPLLRTVQEHEKQLDRAAAVVLPVTPEEERSLGLRVRENLGRAVVIGTAAPEMAELERRLQAIGRELGGQSSLTRFRGQYVVTVVHGDMRLNAFAIPGGFLYVTEGLLRRLRHDADAMAFVLGHEIGHVELGHCLDTFRGQLALEKIGLDPVGDAATLVRALAALHFSETQELEADRYGQELAISFGGSPMAPLRAFDLMGLTDASDDETKRDPGAIALEGLSDYFRTHPATWERRNALKRRAGI